MGRSRLKIEPGTVYGRWTVIRAGVPDAFGQYSYLCRCECGKEKWVRSMALRSGKSKSCGCLRSEMTRERNVVNAKIMQSRKKATAAKSSESRVASANAEPRPYIPKDMAQFGFDAWMFRPA